MKRFLPLFAAITAAISSNSLAAQIKFSDPTNYPISVIIDFPTLTSADLNNDGIEDLIVNSDGSSTIRIFINKGDGTFTTTQSITNIYMPSAITTGDFNNDGLNDIVVSSQEPNYKVINVLLNDKDDPGSFPFDIPYHTGDDPILDLKTIDFNNDGALDLVGVARTDGLYLLQNDGQGAFSVTNTYAAGESAVKVDIGDLDGDSFKDIVVGSQYSRSGDEQDIKIFKNNQDGTFDLTNSYMAGNGISTFALEDINDDQKSDIIVSSGTSNAIFLLINNGSGQFSEATNIVSINGSSAVICNDFDGDGLKDLILSSFQDQNLKIYTNNSASPGSFTAQNSFGQLYPWSSASEDFNNDGKPDLAIMDLRFGAMMVYMNISNWALPVDLKDFTGKIKNGAVRLEWNSGVEANFSHYEIEKREDDSAYVKIGSIEALGSGSNYHFNINQSVKYTNYRLKLVNNDGSSSYSKVVSIFNPMNSDAIKLWPNPGKNFIHVQLKQSGTFKIYDNSGKLIQSVKIEKGENQIDIRRLSAGTYYGITGTTKLKFIKR